MNRQTLLIITGGFFMAVLVAIFIQVTIGSSQKKAVTAEKAAHETVEVLVAANDLKKGDTLKASGLKWQEWPMSATFTGAVIRKDNQDTTAALSGMVRRDIMKGEPVMQSALVPEDSPNFLSASLTEGMRAMAISVNAASSAGGFIKAGDAVDVILTYDIRLPRDEALRESAAQIISKNAAQTILQNVRVLAVDQEAKTGGDPKIGRTVTLEVGTHEAEVLALAETMGKLSLSLRKIGDERISNVGPHAQPAVTDLRLSNVMQEMTGGRQTENNAGTSRKIVRIYNGSSASNIRVNQTASY